MRALLQRAAEMINGLLRELKRYSSVRAGDMLLQRQASAQWWHERARRAVLSFLFFSCPFSASAAFFELQRALQATLAACHVLKARHEFRLPRCEERG